MGLNSPALLVVFSISLNMASADLLGDVDQMAMTLL
jgi:hypothetical protein